MRLKVHQVAEDQKKTSGRVQEGLCYLWIRRLSVIRHHVSPDLEWGKNQRALYSLLASGLINISS